jgi:RNA polymerase sigma-70 factor, ECF subfamily
MQSLIDRLLKGDEQAVATFYQTYSPRLLCFLQKRLPREEDAQEILNDIFLDAVDDLPTLHKQTNLQAWLFKIAANKTADFYRKRKIKSFLFSQMPYFEIIANEINEPEFQLEKDKIRDSIEAAFLDIAVHYQQILRMHYEDGMPVKAIAVTLEVSPKAAESLLFRARQSFIKSYERA